MTKTLKFDRTYPHAPEKVWRALTERTALAEWLMPNDFEPRVGHKFNFRTQPQPGFDGIVHCEVLECEALSRLAYSWEGGDLKTVVTWMLEPAPGGTKLHMEQAGFEGERGIWVSEILERGWNEMFDQGLPAVIEGRSTEACHA